MKLSAVIESTAVTVFKSPPSVSPFIPRIVAALVARYEFVEFPKTAEQFKSDVTLLFGTYDGFVIDKLTIYNDGLLLIVKADTTGIDRLIDDIIKMAHDEFDAELSTVERKTYYNSQIEVEMSNGFAHFLDRLAEFPAMLARMVQPNYDEKVAYTPKSIGFFTGKQEPITPGRFLIEPRVGPDAAENLFYSEAPVTTEQHCQLIEALEKLL